MFRPFLWIYLKCDRRLIKAGRFTFKVHQLCALEVQVYLYDVSLHVLTAVRSPTDKVDTLISQVRAIVTCLLIYQAPRTIGEQ